VKDDVNKLDDYMDDGGENEEEQLALKAKREQFRNLSLLLNSPVVINSLQTLLLTYASRSTRVCATAIYLITSLCCHSLPLLPILVEMLHNPGCLLVRGLIVNAIISMGSLGIETLISAVQAGRDIDLESFILTVMANHPAIIRLVLLPFVVKEMRYGNTRRKLEMVEILERIQDEIVGIDEANNIDGGEGVDYDSDGSMLDTKSNADSVELFSLTKQSVDISLPPSLVKTRSMVMKELYNCLLLLPDDRLRSAMHIRYMGVDGERILIKLLDSKAVNYRVRV
jgi:hypothetical protein